MPANHVTVKAQTKRYSRWFRMYVEFIADPKTATLTDRQGWTWVRLLAIAKQSDDGMLPPTKDIAFHLRCSFNDAENTISDLIELGLLDVVTIDAGGSRIKPHGWDQRQFQWDGNDRTNSTRQKRWRERSRSRNGRVTVGVTENCSESVSVSAVEYTNLSIQEGSDTYQVEDAHTGAREVTP